MKAGLIFLGLLAAASAQAEPFAGAQLVEGQALHSQHCVACHSRNFGGPEGSAIYLRPDRKIKTPAALAQQITFCASMLKLSLFPEEELNIAGYLNSQYYKFK